MIPSEPSKADRFIARTFRIGIAICSIFMLAGFLISLFRKGADDVSPAALWRMSGAQLVAEPAAWITLGILVLMATPIARVAITIAVFSRERDIRYTFIAVFVLLMIGVSIVSTLL
ncbi:MAG: DUF1634 domain-containing protein [Bacteroidota bacterium]|nr:DUF1634 domain-containing protein [Bacteroidota bacterium]